MMGSSIFLSTPSARRATTAWMEQNDTEIFLSTPSARRATFRLPWCRCSATYFYPRPLRGGRHAARGKFRPASRISIHALCEEGDFSALSRKPTSPYFYPRPLRGGRPAMVATIAVEVSFLSTPSARRATRKRNHNSAGQIFLSTPSARRATLVLAVRSWNLFHFYPRPLRGGRLEQQAAMSYNSAISIHALCEEGDWQRRNERRHPTVFLSTPSARRATAKTETKSLFSNKLYNILHEFRRALIYNGSKSYPNHAK